MPKEWYEQFKALIDEKARRNIAGTLLGPDGKPVLDFDAVIKGTKLTELNEEQAAKLYEAAKTGIIVPAKNKAESYVLYNDKDNKPTILAPNMNINNEENQNIQELEERQKPAKQAIEKFSQLDDSEIVSESKIKDYSIASKTMTDLYGGPDVDMPLSNNYIMDAEGHYLSKTGNIWKDYDQISKAIKSGNYTFIALDKEKDHKELFYSIQKEENSENYAKKQLDTFNVVMHDTKIELEKLNKDLARNLAGNKEAQPILDMCQTITKAVDRNAGQEELNGYFKQIEGDLDKFLNTFGTPLKIANIGKLNAVNKFKSIGEAIKNGTRPSVADDKSIKNPLSDWYTDFKEMIKNENVLMGENGSLYLRGNSDEPLIDLKDAFREKDLKDIYKDPDYSVLMHLSDSQIQKLHDISKTTGIFIHDPDHPENTKVIYADDKGVLKTEDSQSMKIKEHRDSCPEMVRNSFDRYEKMPAAEKIGKEQIEKYQSASQGFKAYYDGPDVEAVLDAECVLDGKGDPIRKEDSQWKTYDKVADILNEGTEDGVYFQGIYDKETGQEKCLSYKKEGNEIKMEYCPPVLKGKSDILKELEPIATAMAIQKTKNPYLKKIQNNIKDLAADFEKENGRDALTEKLNDLAHDADMYFMIKSGTKLSKTGADKLEMVNRIREIRDAVNQGKLPSETPLDRVKFMQTQLAAKFVKGYAVSMRDYSKDPVIADKARAMLTDPKSFEKGVNEIMANPAFQYLYGSRKEGDGLDVINRINQGLDLKASQLVKNVKQEAELPSKDRPAFESYMKQQAPRRIDAVRGINGRLALSRHAEILDALEDMRKQLTAVGRSGAASAELQNLEKELAISTIRLQNGNNFMNVKAQLAQLGDAADTYMNKVMNSKMNGRRFQRFNIANQIRQVSDAVAEDKPIANSIKHGDELKRDSLAARLANQVAKELLKSDSPAAQKRGKRMLLEPKIFEAEKQKIRNSTAFTNLYVFNEGALEDAITSKPESIYKDFLAEKKRTEPELQKNGPDRKKLEEKAIEKEKEDKMISLSI